MNSPFYRGTKLWNKLNQDIQFSEDRWIFKGHIAKMYNGHCCKYVSPKLCQEEQRILCDDFNKIQKKN